MKLGEGNDVTAEALPVMSQEERVRHEHLFFSQLPVEGLLPGEKARDLFMKSKLPLQVLSKIWILADAGHDNMLDHVEFAVAMHLLQRHLTSRGLPGRVPPACFPPATEVVNVPTMTEKEHRAFCKMFEAMDQDHRGVTDTKTSRQVLLTSELSLKDLSVIWDLSDTNRDGKLSRDEFAIACHLIRQVKKGLRLSGPVNTHVLLPNHKIQSDRHVKRLKLEKLKQKKTKLMILREKRKSELLVENERVELWKEKLKVVRFKHQVLRDGGHVSASESDDQGRLYDRLQECLRRIEVVTKRLKRDEDAIRAETARLIMDEDRVNREVKKLEEEAAAIKAKREMNVVMTDLDPFHQLYEERKGDVISAPRVSGDDVFLNNADFNHNPWEREHNEGVAKNLLELTQGFDDNFVDLWGQVKGQGQESGLNDAEEKEDTFNFSDDDEQIFKTVPVLAEDYTLWRMPAADVTDPDVETLHRKLEALNKRMADFHEKHPQQVVLVKHELPAKQEAEYDAKEPESEAWDAPVVRKNRSSSSDARIASRRRSYAAGEPADGARVSRSRQLAKRASLQRPLDDLWSSAGDTSATETERSEETQSVSSDTQYIYDKDYPDFPPLPRAEAPATEEAPGVTDLPDVTPPQDPGDSGVSDGKQAATPVLYIGNGNVDSSGRTAVPEATLDQESEPRHEEQLPDTQHKQLAQNPVSAEQKTDHVTFNPEAQITVESRDNNEVHIQTPSEIRSDTESDQQQDKRVESPVAPPRNKRKSPPSLNKTSPEHVPVLRTANPAISSETSLVGRLRKKKRPAPPPPSSPRVERPVKPARPASWAGQADTANPVAPPRPKRASKRCSVAVHPSGGSNQTHDKRHSLAVPRQSRPESQTSSTAAETTSEEPLVSDVYATVQKGKVNNKKNMDPETRREELEKLRMQFFGSGNNTAVRPRYTTEDEIDFGANDHLSDHRTVITLGDDDVTYITPVAPNASNDGRRDQSEDSECGSNKLVNLLDDADPVAEQTRSRKPERVLLDLDSLQSKTAETREHHNDPYTSSNLTFDPEAMSPRTPTKGPVDNTFNLYIGNDAAPPVGQAMQRVHAEAVLSEDSDLSENEAHFSATFTPSAARVAERDGVAQRSSVRDTHSGGITLLSYQMNGTNDDSATLAASEGSAGAVTVARDDDAHKISPVVKKRQNNSLVRRLRSQNSLDGAAAPAEGEEARVSARVARSREPPPPDNHADNQPLIDVSLPPASQEPEQKFWDNLSPSNNNEQKFWDNLSPANNNEQKFWDNLSDSSSALVTAPKADTNFVQEDIVQSLAEPVHVPPVTTEPIQERLPETNLTASQSPPPRTESAPQQPITSLRSVYRGEPYREMDPTTGLRRTGATTPVEKAMQFAEKSELSFKVRRREPEEGEARSEKDSHRQDILKEMRVRKKDIMNDREEWVPDIVKEHQRGETLEKSDSERKYEERKRTAMTSPTESSPPFASPLTSPRLSSSPTGEKAPGEVDAGSIGDQTHTVKVWEEKLASGDVSLFPKLPAVRKSATLEELQSFKSEVEEQSIADLASTRHQWEQKVKAMEDERAQNNNIYNIQKPVPDRQVSESALEREIRLEQERERATREEQKRLREGIPETQNKDETQESSYGVQQQQSYQEMTEADRGEVYSNKDESIVEREIREQHERERAVQKTYADHNKEFEQSEAERIEKESELVDAHESIVEKEIRLQREREEELQRQRGIQGQHPTGLPRSVSAPVDVKVPSVQKVHQFLPQPPGAVTQKPVSQPPVSDSVRPAVTVRASAPVAAAPARMEDLDTADMESVTYEEAIAAHSHPGESIIARELREQREREAELRALYLQRGVTLTAAPDCDDVTGPADAYQQEVRPFKQENGRRGSQDSESSSTARSRDSDTPRERTVHKVTPMLEDLREERTYRYEPMNESPIDREIRLARERENELRAAKGLPLTPAADQDTVDYRAGAVAEESPRRAGVRADDKQSMKKFASSRLQSEIQREKQRELDLRGQGRITTTSDERTERRNYRDVIPPEEPVQRPRITRPAAQPEAEPAPPPERQNGSEHAPSAPVAKATVKPSASTEFYERKQLRKQPNPRESKIEKELREMKEREEELRNLRKLINGGADVSEDYILTESIMNGVLPSRGGAQAQPSSPSLPASPQNTGSAEAAEGTQDGLTRGGDCRPCAQPATPGDGRKPLRRKSALAEEWERRFGETTTTADN